MKLCAAVALLVLTGTVPGALSSQETPPAASRPADGTTTVSGFVHDSLGGWRLRGAVVQIVAADDPARFSRTTMSDSVGAYSIAEVPDGKYTLGFFHPMLDTLGLPQLARSITVARQLRLTADLAIPGPRRIREALCPAEPGQSGGGLVMGVVRNARDRKPLSNARVVGQWRELQFSGGRMVQRVPRKVTTSGENGGFLLCHVPARGTMSIVATAGADSTDQVEIEVPAEGFLRRDVFIGASQTVASADTIPASDTLAFRPPVTHVGEGRLTGTVVTADGANPIPNAVVGILNGPQTRANDRGAWTINNAPPGSRTLEVRALGRVPVRRSVDVVDGAAPIRIAMTSFKTVLDTLKVTAGISSSLDFVEFENRRKKSAAGRFLTASDIYKRNPIETSELFRNFPTLQVVTSQGTDSILMKSAFGSGQCAPTIVLNGTQMLGITSSELDAFVRPERIIGIEVYSESNVPPQFQAGMSGCGSIVIWARN